MELSEEWNRKTQDHFIAPVSWICDQDIAERKGSVYDIGERFPIDYTRIAHTTSTGRVRVQAVNDEIVFSFHSPSFKDGNESYANLTFFGNALHIEVVRGFELTPSRLQPFIDVLCLLNFSPKNALAFLDQYRVFGKAVKAYQARELEFEIARRVDNAIAQSCGNHYLAYHNDEMTIVQVMEDATTHIQWYNKRKLDNRLREVLALRIEQARNRKPRVYHMED
jgi:hypothetical protein